MSRFSMRRPAALVALALLCSLVVAPLRPAVAAAAEPASFTGSLDPATQQYESFTYTVDEPGIVSGVLTTAQDVDYDLYLRDPAGALVEYSVTPANPEQVSFDATDTGDYTFIIQALDAGEYTLDVAVQTSGPDRWQATVDADGQAYRRYPIEVTEPGLVTGQLAWSGDANLNVYVDGPGDGFEYSATPSNPEQVSLEADTPGTYDLIVEAEAGAAPFELITDFQPNPGRTFLATLDADAQAWRTYPIDVTEPGLLRGVLEWSGDADLELFLKDPAGELVEYSVTSSPTEQISFEAPAAGEYQFIAHAVSGVAPFSLTQDLQTGEDRTYLGTLDQPAGQQYRAYEFEAPAAGTLDVALDWPGDSDMNVYLRAPDETLEVGVSDGKPETLTYEGPAGTYSVLAQAVDGSEAFALDVDFTAGEVTNTPPAITAIDDQAGGEGDDVTIPVEVTDPDTDDTVTVSVDGLPDGLTYDAAQAQISGAIADGAAANSPYDVVVTADDGVNDPATEDFAFAVTAAPAEACSPISTLPCADVPVDLPFNLGFDNDRGALVDNAGFGTGFTMVDPPSQRLAVDGEPSNPDAPGYEPGLLSVADGALMIDSTKGIAFKDLSQSSDTNSQINTLGVGVDVGTGSTEIATTVVAPDFPNKNDSQQGGLWFGLDEDNFAKLVVANAGNGNAKVQLQREVGAQVGTDDEINSDTFADGADVDLRVVVDAAAGTATGFYTVAGGAEVELGVLPLPQAFLDGEVLSDGETGPVSFAGIFATNRRGSATSTIDLTFDRFVVTPAVVDDTAPDAPANLAATPGDGQVALTWDANTDDDLAGYNLYRSESAAVEVDPTNQVNTVLLGGTTVTDDTVTNGTEYFYVLTAVDETGNESTVSNEVSATPTTAMGPTIVFAPDALDVTVAAGESTTADVDITADDEAQVPFAVTDDADWLTVAPADGDTPEALTVTVDAADLDAGEYDAVVTGTSEGYDDGTLPVSVTVTDDQPDFTAFVNFNAADGEQPDGYLRDFGQPYGPRTGADQGSGLTYGWVEAADGTTPLDLTQGTKGNGRDRNTSQTDQRLDSLVHMQADDITADGDTFTGVDVEGVWEVAVPDGTYEVTVAAGDAALNNYDKDPEEHALTVEGTQAVAPFVPTGPAGSVEHHETGTVTVTVTDGNLTIDADGGTNTKIDYVEIAPAGPDTAAPGAPAGLLATAGDGSVSLNWDDNVEPDLAGYNIYRSTTSPVDTAGQPLNGSAVVVDAQYDDAGLDNDTEYFYVVTAVDDAGNESAVSNEASATPQAIEAVDVDVNFQSEAAPTPDGFVADFGQAYGDRGGDLTYGWVAPGTATALSLVGNGRDRDRSGIDQRLDTLIHMQYGDTGGTTGVTAEGAWEIAVPNGVYQVTVSVGDEPSTTNGYDSTHALNLEGAIVVDEFQADSGTEYAQATALVGVDDGRLTMDAVHGTNTKPNSVQVERVADQPFVSGSTPGNGDTDIPLNFGGVGADVVVPGSGVGVDIDTLDGNVALLDVATGAEIPGTAGTTGGRDAITFAPDPDTIAPETEYRFVVDGVRSESGQFFAPYEIKFTTGEDDGSTGGGGGTDRDPVTAASFEKVELPSADGNFFTTLTVGPDGKLYGATNSGQIKRYEIAADGTLSNAETLPGVAGSGPRLLIGLVFAPDSTPTNPVAYVTHTIFGFSNVSQQFGGTVTRLSGADLENRQDVFVNLPRSEKDHVTNSIAFGPDGDVYFLQGSNSAGGAPDSSWGFRDEQLLSAALLTFDPSALPADSQLPIDVKTAQGGSYDPFAAAAPLRIYATGIRNAYDLTWHSNGELYVPTNGTAAGANSPAVNANNLPDACDGRRIDQGANGPYTGPSVPAANGHDKQRDFLFRVADGGYYGHPNPTRCEWALNVGNKTGADDPGEGTDGNSKYPVGTMPDRNYRGWAFDFEFNKSPNGVIEYQNTDVFGGELAGRLLVVRYSNNNDIITLTPNDGDGDIAYGQTGDQIPGFDGFDDPLDLVENPATGDLYVSQYDQGGSNQKLWLLRAPRDGNGGGGGQLTADSDELVFSSTKTATDGPRTVTVDGADEPITATIDGPDAAAFELDDSAAGAGGLAVTFDPAGTVGSLEATLQIAAGDATTSVPLYGLSANGEGGGNEPTFQAVVDTLGHPVDVGWTNLNGGTQPTAKGDEVLEPVFTRASDGEVTMTPVASYAPFESVPFGWYDAGGPDDGTLHEVGALANGQQQTLNPTLASGGTTFDPGTGSFGFYYESNFFDRTGYTEDARNDAGGLHRARVYPAVDRAGVAIPNAYLVAFEDANNGDYQDYVFLVRNVTPADAGSGGGGGGGEPDTDVAVNFQTADFTTPDGWDPDSGQGYAASRGYGWVVPGTSTPVSTTAGARARTTPSDPLRQSLIIMTNDAVAALNDGSWEHEVSDGEYEVTVSVGDGAFYDSTHGIEVEGATAIDDFVPTAAEPFAQGTVTTDVTDGRLTVDATGTNSKINWITFDRVGDATPVALGDGELSFENPQVVPFDDRLVMSRIQSTTSNPATNDTAKVVLRNTGSEDLTVSDVTISDAFTVVDPPTLPLTIATNDATTWTVAFTGTPANSPKNKLFEGALTITSDASNGSTNAVELAGMWQKQSEGGNEPNVAQIVDAFGYGTTILGPGEQLNNQGRIETVGDEVLVPYWRRASTSKPVAVRQLAAYHSCCSNTASFFWHPETSNATTKVLTHNGAWAQTLLPRINGSATAPAQTTFTPSSDTFGFKIDPEWSDPTRNNKSSDDCSGGNDTCGHHVRVWPAEDRAGDPIANTYIVVMDYSGINYDFNDNVYLVSNIVPAGTEPEPEPATPIRINAGGPAVTTGGVDWSADTAFSGGKSYVNATLAAGDDVIAGTTDDVLYVSEHSATANLGSFSYAIPVAGNGSYTVRLHFAEIYWGAQGGNTTAGNDDGGERVLNANIEGGAVEIDGLDINATVGPQTALVDETEVEVTDGTVDIAFGATVNQPKVSAIEVIPTP